MANYRYENDPQWDPREGEDDETPEPVRGPSTYVFAFYELDRQYGGPEEGWWYNTGDIVRIFMVKRCTEERADKLCYRANRLLNHLQRHKRSTGSVLYRGGRFSVHVYENNAPSHFPQERPYYE